MYLDKKKSDDFARNRVNTQMDKNLPWKRKIIWSYLIDSQSYKLYPLE